MASHEDEDGIDGPWEKAMSASVSASKFSDRSCLYRQGFMKPFKAPRKAKVVETVGCHECLGWHPRGKHTAAADVRRANRAAAKASGVTAMQYAVGSR